MDKKTILVIEDESALSFALKAELSFNGFAVEVAHDGEEGMKKILHLKPQLVILDLLLPKKDGFAILEEMRSKNLLSAIPVIVVSNLGERETIEKVKTLGAREYLVKTSNTLEGIITKVKSLVA